MKKTACLIFVSLALILSSCAGAVREPDLETETEMEAVLSPYTVISQDRAKEMMSVNDGHIVIDCRRMDEYVSGHIPEAVCIPNESIFKETGTKLPDKEQIILIYCRTGRRSKEAARKLVDLGYVNVYEFGGILEWDGQIVKGSEPGSYPKKNVASALILQIKGKSLRTEPMGEAYSGFMKTLSKEQVALLLKDDTGMKSAPFPFSFSFRDSECSVYPGDIVLIDGNTVAICYEEKTGSFTRIAHILDLTHNELIELLGTGDVFVSFVSGAEK